MNYIHKNGYLIVGVPDSIEYLSVPNEYEESPIMSINKNRLKLPKGQYTIIGEVKDISEEVAKQILGVVPKIRSIDYTGNKAFVYEEQTAREFFQEFIKYHGFSNAIILKTSE